MKRQTVLLIERWARTAEHLAVTVFFVCLTPLLFKTVIEFRNTVGVWNSTGQLASAGITDGREYIRVTVPPIVQKVSNTVDNINGGVTDARTLLVTANKTVGTLDTAIDSVYNSLVPRINQAQEVLKSSTQFLDALTQLVPAYKQVAVDAHEFITDKQFKSMVKDARNTLFYTAATVRQGYQIVYDWRHPKPYTGKWQKAHMLWKGVTTIAPMLEPTYYGVSIARTK